MAIYPNGNPGVSPIDLTTDVGKARVTIGDTSSTPYNPVQVGYENYSFASDADIAGWISQSDGDTNGILGYFWLMRWSISLAPTQTIQTDDLRVTQDSSKASAGYKALADYYFGLSGFDESFMIVPTGTNVTDFSGYVDGPVTHNSGLIADPSNPGYWIPA